MKTHFSPPGLVELALYAGSLLLLLFNSGLGTQEPKPIAGVWQGKLQVQGAELRLVFHIEQDSTGALTATMDSPDQGARGIKVDDVSFANDTLRLRIRAIQGDFAGKIDHKQKLASGAWTQAGMKLPLELQHVAKKDAFSVYQPKEITLPVEKLKPYAGSYELQPGATITITVGDSTLMAQVTGQPKVPIFPESETRFFYKVVDAQIEFHTGESGAVESLTLFQAGQKIKAKKVK